MRLNIPSHSCDIYVALVNCEELAVRLTLDPNFGAHRGLSFIAVAATEDLHSKIQEYGYTFEAY